MYRLREWIRRPYAMKLRTQLLISFLLLIAILLVSSSFFLYKNILDMLQHRSQESTVASFKQVERQITEQRAAADSITKTFMMDPEFERFILDQKVTPYGQIQLIKYIQARLFEQMQLNPALDSLYLFTNDGRVIGATLASFFYKTGMQDHGFYASALREQAETEYPGIIWEGGHTNLDFTAPLLEFGRTLPKENLVSAARAIKPFYHSSKSAVMVINYGELSIFENYKDLIVSIGSSAFITDGEGHVISHNDKSRLGQNEPLYAAMQNNYGSFERTNPADGRNEQTIYYRIKGSDWTLAMQIPIAAYLADIINLRTTIIYILVIGIIVAALLSFYWTLTLTRPFYNLVRGMRTLEQGRFGLTIPIKGGSHNEIGAVVKEFNRMSLSIRQLIDENNRIERAKRSAEIRMLQAQINPHFLLNTLNTIKWMAISVNASNIANSLTALGGMIGPIFRESEPFIPLGEELKYIDNYMRIMNNRYGEGVQWVIGIPEQLQEFQVPRLLLQPVIENSLLHGMETSQFRGIISIDGRVEGEDILLMIRDNGAGMSESRLAEVREMLLLSQGDSDEKLQPKKHQSVGLTNVQQRIQLFYGEKYGLSIDSAEGDGTTVTFRLPAVRP